MRIKKKQFEGFLSQATYEEFYNKGISVGKFLDCQDDTERMALMNLRKNHPRLIQMKKYCEFIPTVDVEYTVKPIAQTILKVDVTILPKWIHNNKWHSKS